MVRGKVKAQLTLSGQATKLIYQSPQRSQEKMKISGAQITAARNLLKITQAELAEASGVSERTVMRFEADETAPQRAILDKILTELDRRGIEFSNGSGIGVRLNFEKAAQYSRAVPRGRSEPER